MYHFWRISFITLILFSLISDIDIARGKPKWEVMFSDWTKVSCDYSTNAVVHWWYNGKTSKYYRQESAKEINGRLSKGDTIIIGLDYYALFGVSLFVPPKIKQDNYSKLMEGKVITYRTFEKDTLWYWEGI